MSDDLEFDFVDKSDWGKGPWQNEPDKKQWRDRASSYLCLVIRSPAGSLCGYVGVSKGHPAYGLHYDGIPTIVAEIAAAEFEDHIKKWGEAGRPPITSDWFRDNPLIERPDPYTLAEIAISNIQVHGGLTYSKLSHEATPDGWEQLKRNFVRARLDAKRHPYGDAARFLERWRGCDEDYELYCNKLYSCLIATRTEKELWWFGFDCGHAGDVSPAMNALLRKMDRADLASELGEEVYRDLAYVEGQCAELACQLKQMEGIVKGETNLTQTKDE
jgi:hypothetical protein